MRGAALPTPARGGCFPACRWKLWWTCGGASVTLSGTLGWAPPRCKGRGWLPPSAARATRGSLRRMTRRG
eukprot:2191903-Alexandrium_andersonii.AAC.1